MLNKIGDMAEDLGYHVLRLEVPEDQRLAEYLAPGLKEALLGLSRIEKAREIVAQAAAMPRGFASAFRVSIGSIDIGVTEPSTADSGGNLEVDLPKLLVACGKAAQAAGTGVVLSVDEIQYLSEEDLRALIVALHSGAEGPALGHVRGRSSSNCCVGG